MKKTYKDLSPQEETELVLWLGFFEDSVQNAQMQIKRWKHLKNGWDLLTFFVAVVWIENATKGLEHFLTKDDAEVWAILKEFKKTVERYKLKALRNDIVHRERIFKWWDKKRNPLPPSPILMLGVYMADKDEYCFGIHRVKISEVFNVVETMIQDIKRIAANRLTEFYETGSFPGMIPFTYLHVFAADR